MFDRSNRLPGMFEPSNPATRKPLKSNRKHDSLARTLCATQFFPSVDDAQL